MTGRDSTRLDAVNVVKRLPGGSGGEQLLALAIRAARLPTPMREYRFHGVRLWRFDFAWPELKLAVEIEGATGSRARLSRHTSALGFEADAEKYNSATLAGWKVLRFSTAMVEDGRAIETIEQAFTLVQ